MRTRAGGAAVALVAVLLGILAVAQFRSQDVYSRSLQQETPESLTTLIAGLSDRNNALREEIFDLRLRVEAARESVASGRGLLEESERQLRQLTVFAGRSAVSGPGVAIAIDGPFDERAMLDLVNELRNSGAEAIGVGEVRVGPRSYFAPAPGGALALDGVRLGGPWTVRSIGNPEVLHVAMTRTGGLVGQFQLIYPRTAFRVTREPSLDLPAVR